MTNATETVKKELENIFIIQPVFSDKYKVLHQEVVSLIESAGGVYAGSIYQNIREINPATFVGIGKLYELKERLLGLENITVLFNGELSPSQTLNISAILDDRKVIDRTTLILDIFAQNATSDEGKLQVELAQLKYIYPRLKGEGQALSRLGGGIGTRGPGETQLESDRRLIRQRIKLLDNKIEEMKKRRSLQTDRRKKNNVKTIALVGYTNTGKSTLMNYLTDAGVYCQNQLFATLDATARAFTIDDVNFVLVDTVGFLQDLPHQLIDSFESTLDVAVNSDLALIVVDGSGDYELQLKTTLDTLNSLNFNSPYIIVVNQCDKLTKDEIDLLPRDHIQISAKTGEGINELKQAILSVFKDDFIFCKLFIPYEKSAQYAKIRKFITERNVSFSDDGQLISAVVPSEYLSLFREYIK